MDQQQTIRKALEARQRGDFQLAQKFAGRALSNAPDNVDLLQFVAALEMDLGHGERALVLLRKALSTAPSNVEVLYNYGAALNAMKRFKEALEPLEAARELRPNHLDVLNNLGLALVHTGQADEAASMLEQAVAFHPRAPFPVHNLALAYAQQNRVEDALRLFGQSIKLGHPRPSDVAFDMAKTLIDHGRGEEARNIAERMALQADSASKAYEAGSIFLSLRDHAQAAHMLRRACDLQADNPDYWFNFAYAARNVCAWEGVDDAIDKGRKVFERSTATVDPFTVVTLTSDEGFQLQAAKRYATRIAQVALPSRSHAIRPSGDRRIKVCYVSSDFCEHATSYLAADVLTSHDRSKFEIVLLSHGPLDKSEMKNRLSAGVDRFVEMPLATPMKIAEEVHSSGVDIVVDLNGYTKGHRVAALVGRPAPVQATWLGFPGTLGADWIDYAIVDRHVVPPEHAEYAFSERLVVLPHSYQPTDARREHQRPPSREQVDLPRHGFVFCCFNNSYKLTPELFDVWMRLLATVEGSVLWLLARQQVVKDNLRREAAKRGVDPSRMVFAAHVANAEHIARQACADLFLDTLPCNAHTTASDALAIGLPVLTCAGNTFAGRVASSLLTTHGFPELIARSLEEYEAKALQLATRPEALLDLRRRLQGARRATPLFDTARFCRGLENGYEQMWSNWLAGKPPQTIYARED